MTADQEAHSKHVRETFALLQEPKYRIGTTEPGRGLLSEVPADILINEIINEMIDGFTYALTLKNNLQSLQRYFRQLEEENQALRKANKLDAS